MLRSRADPIPFARDMVRLRRPGLALLYHGLPLREGDETLTTTHDHYVHHESIRLATGRCGATWRKIPLFAHFPFGPQGV